MRRCRQHFILLAVLCANARCQVDLAATHWGGADAAATSLASPSDGGGGQAGAAGGACHEAVTDLTIPSGNVMLVVERSSVMSTPNDDTCGSCGSYWSTLIYAVDSLTSASSNHFQWGLKLFPSTGSSDACLVTSTMDLPLAPAANAAIVATLNATSPSGGTPVTSAVREVVDYLRTVKDGLPQVILLAMGGTPTCASDDPTQDDTQAALAELDRATEPVVFVLGIGPAGAKLDRLAAAGGTVSAYSSDQIAALLSDIEGWAMTIASCDFPLPSVPQAGQSVSVALDGVQLGQGDPDGFTISPDGTMVIIQGSSCYYLSSHSTLTISVGC
ncbi:MAG: hypothetical protein ABSB49_15140 [Polyangia bacterium]